MRLSAMFWVLVSFLELALPLSAQHASLRFEHFTIEDGLSQNNIYAILQDRQGFLWFGTADGLDRYDGYEIVSFRHDPRDTTSLSHSWVWTLYEDRNGTLWVGTYGGGLNRFDPATETFTHYRHDPDDSNSLGNDYVVSIQEDRAGHLWVGTERYLHRFDRATKTFTRLGFEDATGNPTAVHDLLVDRAEQLWAATLQGLVRLDPETGTAERYVVAPVTPEDRRNRLQTLHEAPNGQLWVGTERGLFVFDPATTRFSTPPASVPAALRAPIHVKAFHTDPDGVVWVGTNAGLYRYDRTTETAVIYRHDASDPHSLSDNTIEMIVEDRSGVLWVGTLDGLNRLNRRAERFGLHTHRPGHPNSLSDPTVYALAEAPDGALWIGTRNGLDHFDPATGTRTHYRHDPDDPNSLSGNAILSLHVDPDGVVWVGTGYSGLNRLDPTTGGVIRFRSRRQDPTALSNDGIMALHRDRQGTLWVATWIGLNRFDPATGTFASYLPRADDPHSLGNQTVTALLEDRNGTLWIGTYGGLDRLDAPGRFTHFRPDPDDPNSLSHHQVTTLFEDQRGRLWVGTSGGLNRFDPETGAFTVYTTREGLPNNTVNCITEDAAGRLWLSTHRGLDRFDPTTEQIKHYGASDGLQGNEFNANSCLQRRDGKMAFGGARGMNLFDPNGIRTDTVPPQVALTRFQIAGRPVHPGMDVEGHVPLTQALTTTEALTLPHDLNVFSFDVAGLHYANPARNRYAYRMDGLDDGWTEIGTRRTVSFTGLLPGRYTFRVRAANSDGVWGDAAALRVQILPPWWQTRWAYVAYVLLGLALVVGAIRWRSRQLERRNRELTRLVAERTAEVEAQRARLETQAEKLMELDEMKSRFFANISHEFRTPLTLIRGPLTDLQAERHGPMSEAALAQLDVALRNTGRLQQLINQLLDLARLEAGKLTLRVAPGDLVAFVRRITSAFTSLAEREDIAFSFDADASDLPLFFDAEQLETALTNLLSNAFKFTPEGGKVDVIVRNAPPEANECGTGAFATIEVRDTGPGIPPEALPHLFDRFYQADAHPHEGTGIGLALAHELIGLHGGGIAVESAVDSGTTFTVRLPKGTDHLDESEMIRDGSRGGWEYGSVHASNAEQEISEDEGDETEKDRSPVQSSDLFTSPHSQTPTLSPSHTVLVVEDNADLRAYLGEHLAPSYRVVEAQDGEEGLAKARKTSPDLIVSDVMMPRMDGLALLRAIRADADLQAIPVILLTARAADTDRLEGLEARADAYLTKPFQPDELLIRVRNLIETRDELRARYAETVVTVAPEELDLKDVDQAFLDRTRALVETHLDDGDFNVTALAEELPMSKRNLARKLKDLTGLTPSVFLRQMRLERARQLLDEHAVETVAEAAYAVGFNTPGYFSRLYRQRFGQSPADVL